MANATAEPAVVDGLSRYDRHRLQAAFRRLAETGASTLEVARAAVWLYSGERERLYRIHLYHRSSGEHVAGGELRREHFPTYFEALDGDALLAVADVHGDSRTSELSEPYAAPLGINSWIDAPVAGSGEEAPLGILRFEHLGPPRSWSAREHSVARTLASSVGTLLEYFDARRSPAAAPGPQDTTEASREPGPEPEELPGARETERAAGDQEAEASRPPPAGSDDGARLEADDLEDAIADGRLALRWQPIRRASDGARAGAEALVRMRRSDAGGLTPAAEFVPRAEERGFIAELDRWVLTRAAERAASWRGSGAPDWIALNVSPFSLLAESYRAALTERIDRGALDPSTVLLQVALDLDRHPTVEVGRALFSLREMGFGISLDLGTAGDELLDIALSGLPADVLEITPDTLGRWEDGGPPAVVREGRRSRGLRLLAKKLETSDQEGRARALGCALLAGRLLGPPVEAGELAEVTGAARTRWAGRPGPDGS